MSEAKLNWSSAEVEQAKLIVGFEGDTSKPWRGSFEATVKRLGHSGGWGEVSLDKHGITVTEVTPGSEEKLRHYLESVIEQANASNPPEEPEEADGDGAEEQEGQEDAGPDAQMQERFRSFAEGQS
jgi:hypothetical protein